MYGHVSDWKNHKTHKFVFPGNFFSEHAFSKRKGSPFRLINIFSILFLFFLNDIYLYISCNQNHILLLFIIHVYMCIFLGPSHEAEGRDRADLALPGQQLALLKDVVKAGT